MRQEIFRAAAVVAIGVVGARARRHNLTEQERVDIPVAAADLVTRAQKLRLFSMPKELMLTRVVRSSHGHRRQLLLVYKQRH